MNYLKKYRQEAGLVRTNENFAVTTTSSKSRQNFNSPSKQTLLYLQDS